MKRKINFTTIEVGIPLFINGILIFILKKSMIDYKKFILVDSSSTDKCIKKLNKNLEDNFSKLIIIINNNKKVVGTVTDGDIRRGFVKGLDIAVKKS